MKTIIIILLTMLAGISGVSAQAGVFDLGGGYSYQHSSYNGGSYTSTRTYSASLGYYFTEDSEVEFMYQDSTNEEFVPNVQNLTYRDRVYSVNFLYHFFDAHSPIKPYLRAGVGQLNRDATGSYQGGYSPPGRLDQLTVIGGIGLKAKLTQRFGFKAEAVSYLAGGNIGSWKNNINVSFGGSFYF
ncbi:MAG: outer membrane beta-barrel protein [Bdellovibrionales bacterium]|nr:outer membrane beta-barrel protein [Oligoflexia bacterium]